MLQDVSPGTTAKLIPKSYNKLSLKPTTDLLVTNFE